jgi:outer membrane protein assembly factor BamB
MRLNLTSQFFLATLIGLSIGGCSTLDAINPFTPSKKVAPLSELQPIPSTSNVMRTWQASVGAANEFTFVPGVIGDSIYAAGRDGAVSRFDKDGNASWRVNLGHPISGGVGSDGKRVAVGTPKGELVVLDANDGKPLWRAQLSTEILSAPAFTGDLVVVRSADSRISGFDAASGKRRWLYQRVTPALVLRSHVGVQVDGNATLAGFPGGKLVAINNQNGVALWEGTVTLPKGATELERIADVTSRPAVGGGTVCSATYQGRVACFDRSNGNLLWSRDMSSSAGVDIDSKYVYVSDDGGYVHALDRSSGASVWKQDKLLNRQLTRPMAIGNEVLVADVQGYVHVLRQTDGTLVGRLTTDGSAVRSEITRTPQGAVVQTISGGLIAIAAK